MRITSQLFVAQLVRRVFAAGGFAVVARKGAEAAGAIFVVTRNRAGEIQLFGPAVQSLSDDGGARQFMQEALDNEGALEARFAREARFDPDFWVVEIETDDAATFLQLVEG